MFLFQNILAKWLEQASRNLELTDKVRSLYKGDNDVCTPTAASDLIFNNLCVFKRQTGQKMDFNWQRSSSLQKKQTNLDSRPLGTGSPWYDVKMNFMMKL